MNIVSWNIEKLTSTGENIVFERKKADVKFTVVIALFSMEPTTVEVAYNESPGTFKSDSLYPEFVTTVAPVITNVFPAASL